ncbi:LysR family transcriptional regulator [Humibacter sp.]|uniref:LysR family transcriptional regulator n=1 Tax=Humibacter sp. TaxID=1940291 RepID=UPI003F808BE1
MEPTISQLRLVALVGRTHSFTEAARQANLSQPALSKAIRDLERRLGLPLFDRESRPVMPTPDGSQFLSVAEGIVAEFDKSLGRFAGYRAGLSGSFIVAALPSVTAGPLPGLLGEFLDSRPEARIDVIDRNAAQVSELVMNGDVEVGLTEMPKDEASLRVLPFGADEMVAVVPTRHRLARRTEIEWAELAEDVVLQLPEGSSLRRISDAAFASSGTGIDRSRQVGSVAAAAAMVAADLGVAALSRTALSLARAEVATVPLANPSVARQLAIITRQVPALSPVAAEFVAFASSSLRASNRST